MKTNNVVVGIVDPISAGVPLASEVRKKGGTCVEIRTSPNYSTADRHSFRENDFDYHLIHQGNIFETAQTAKKIGITHVIAGGESGIEFADQLSECLGLLSNGTKLSEARRDKYKQAQALQKAGLDIIEQALFSDLESAQKWAQDRYPVFGKPPKSKGSDGSFVAQNPEELKQGWNTVWGVENIMGFRNKHVLLQEYVQGAVEWAVNTVSCQGKHTVTDLWQYDKRKLNGAPAVYFETNLMPFSGQEPLMEYGFATLDALGIQYGAAHLEIFERAPMPGSSQKRYTLVEANLRLPGILPALATACTKRNQAALTVDSFLDPNAFFKSIASFQPLIYKQGKWVSLIAYRDGVLAQTPNSKKLENLPSFFSSIFKAYRKGDWLAKTTDIRTLLGHVLLCHEDPIVLEQDRDEIRKIEDELFIWQTP